MMRHGEGPDAHSSPSPATIKRELVLFSKILNLGIRALTVD
jgi:hypothetical protein